MSDISAWFSVWSGVFLVVLCGCPSSNSGGQARESEKQMVVEKLVPSTVEGVARCGNFKNKLPIVVNQYTAGVVPALT